MQNYYVDLHIHIGRTNSGKPVKITGAKTLTIENILEEATDVKGMDMIGVIDCHVPEVILELEKLIEKGEVFPYQEGGLRFKNVTLLLGSEIEIYDENCHGPIHTLAFLPTIEKMKDFSNWLSTKMKNITLSSQRIYADGRELQSKVKELSGIFIPAHVFTPYKSLYGRGVKHSLTEVFDEKLIDGIELGLSSNTDMADQIQELHNYTFVSNSDAHSLPKIAREYQIIQMEEPTFEEFRKALKNEEGRKIVANYGLDPLLGKYHKTTCEKCYHLIEDVRQEVCPSCGHKKIVKGVFDRLQELKNTEEKGPNRPPYIHQVPLEFIPGLGPKTLRKLRDHFRTEMSILHEVPEEALREVVSDQIVDAIMNARGGTLTLQAGGGGKYGKVDSSK
ncbi:endonuclease Q family protein [Ferdinandcohnia quinoae]|uniref:Endonuclease Q family protein n=1 Tax=Fredinandcohnia quinoae TaxID=2918902 RepID=A0AAW5E4K9_9BACI|nr:endonuclease Q family protein [Fredinandcohnia sp. SECRCQ15]MCH1624832.1 endonuclease Q family protein [Fredinandcohnia sp. SECRCQ15]